MKKVFIIKLENMIVLLVHSSRLKKLAYLPLLSTNANLFCSGFKVVVKWNYYLELCLQLWFPLRDFM